MVILKASKVYTCHNIRLLFRAKTKCSFHSLACIYFFKAKDKSYTSRNIEFGDNCYYWTLQLDFTDKIEADVSYCVRSKAATYVFCTFIFQELCILTSLQLIVNICANMEYFEEGSKSQWDIQNTRSFELNVHKVNSSLLILK